MADTNLEVVPEIDLSGDGKVTKRILKEGDSEEIPQGKSFV